MCTDNPWILTDDDCMQYRRKYDDTSYEFIQMLHVGEEEYTVCRCLIDLEDYDEEEIIDALNLFGYASREEMISIYGTNDADAIMAECIFECEACNGNADYPVAFKSRECCEQYIKNIIKCGDNSASSKERNMKHTQREYLVVYTEVLTHHFYVVASDEFDAEQEFYNQCANGKIDFSDGEVTDSNVEIRVAKNDDRYFSGNDDDAT